MVRLVPHSLAFLALPIVSAQAALALEPSLPSCAGVVEAGVRVFAAEPLGPSKDGIYSSGAVIEGYRDRRHYSVDRAVDEEDGPGPVLAQLDHFDGFRVTHCATGRFVAFEAKALKRESDLYGGLAMTEFLRDDIQAGRAVSYESINRAVAAVVGAGAVHEFRETAETCSCSLYFSDLRPKGMTPFDERTDVE